MGGNGFCFSKLDIPSVSMNRPVAAGILPAVEDRHLATRKKPRHYQGLGNAATVLTANAPFRRAGSHGSTAGRMPAATAKSAGHCSPGTMPVHGPNACAKRKDATHEPSK